MREVRVNSLDKLEVLGDELRLSANSGELGIVFPRGIWDQILDEAPDSEDPQPGELEELNGLKRRLIAFAGERSFNTVLQKVQCGGEDSGLQYDLVLRPSEPFAVTTGYLFAPVVRRELMEAIGAALEEDGLVEQAYVVGAVVKGGALAAGDDNLKALSVRGRRCTTSRFEMAPELWQVLSGRMGWSNVETVVPGENKG